MTTPHNFTRNQHHDTSALARYCRTCGLSDDNPVHSRAAIIMHVNSTYGKHPNISAIAQVYDNTELHGEPLVSRDNALLAMSIILGGFMGIIALAFLMPWIWSR